MTRSHAHDVLIYVPSVSSTIVPSATPTGGAEVQMPLLARGLADQGARVSMVAFAADGLPQSFQGVDVIPRAPYQARRRRGGKLRELAAIYASLATADGEVVLTRTALPTTGLVALAAKLQRRRFVYSSASDADFAMETVERKRRNAAMFHLGLRLADLIVVQNREQQRLCRERLGRDAVVIGSVAEPASLRTGSPKGFLWAGRLHPCKQPLAYIELARAVPEAHFWFVGVPEPGADGERLHRACREAALAVPNLTMLSPRPRQELMTLLDRAVATVNTSEFEGISNVFLEGWARGVPALTLTHDPDGVIERFGLGVCARGSPEDLVDATRALWSARHDQTAIAERCRTYVREEHDPGSVYRRWHDALLGTKARGHAPARTPQQQRHRSEVQRIM